MSPEAWHAVTALVGATVTAVAEEEFGITLTLSTGKALEIGIDYEDVDLYIKLVEE